MCFLDTHFADGHKDPSHVDGKMDLASSWQSLAPTTPGLAQEPVKAGMQVGAQPSGSCCRAQQTPCATMAAEAGTRPMQGNIPEEE